MSTAPGTSPTPPAEPPAATGAIEVAAPPGAVYGVISDPARLVQVAEETRTILHRRSQVGRVGSRWVGVNRRGRHVWPTMARVVEAEPGRAFAFEVGELGIPVALWRYALEPTATGTRVVESTWDRRPRWFAVATAPLTGVSDRADVNTGNIEATLARLKAVVEGARA